MELTELLRKTLDIVYEEVWEIERTPTPVRVFRGRLQSIGLFVQEVIAVHELLGVDRSLDAI